MVGLRADGKVYWRADLLDDMKENKWAEAKVDLKADLLAALMVDRMD